MSFDLAIDPIRKCGWAVGPQFLAHFCKNLRERGVLMENAWEIIDLANMFAFSLDFQFASGREEWLTERMR